MLMPSQGWSRLPIHKSGEEKRHFIAHIEKREIFRDEKEAY
jgi:hypothetical protein